MSKRRRKYVKLKYIWEKAKHTGTKMEERVKVRNEKQTEKEG
jgi:hypothetical protein